MPVQVMIPTPLRKLTAEKEQVPASGSTVAEVIDDLEKNHAGIKERVLTPEGKAHRFILIFVNDEDIRFTDNLATPVKDGDTVSIVPAIA
ncbi:MAG: MoaD/ThiS family protein, partial [Verrucomicrobiae bacterium]|nr:MoaD/ThiS family protein [Verrucomicrobiae bacterium]